MKLRSHLLAALAVALSVALTGGAASACHVVGKTKSGERRCITTYVYKSSGSWIDPSSARNPVERCRSVCLRDAMKWGTSTQQAAYFKMCKRNMGCQ